MKYLTFVALITMGFISSCSKKSEVVPMPENPVWQRSQIVPAPSFVEGVNDFHFDASDGWLMINEPEGDIVELLSADEGWSPMTKQMTNTGFRVPNYETRLFKRKFYFPDSFEGQRVIIRFEGVAHAARLYVNGQFVRDHWGSFSAWTADITDYIEDGEAIVGVFTDERRNGLAAYTNGCAFEPLYISGIQYGVSCYAVPQDYIVRANPDIFFDDEYKNADLRIYMHLAQHAGSNANEIEVVVKSPDGKLMNVKPTTYTVPENAEDFYIQPTVESPVKWDAEHPELCTMEVSLFSDGKKLETVSRKIGFREVELRGRNLFVNGEEVKFRGIWGGNNAKQLRDLNINNIRKNWPTQGFLDSCDMFGVYVLDEIPATFTRGSTADDPEIAAQWLELMADMIERDYAHPSVVMWSHGNESSPGATTLKVHNFIKTEDPQRPDMFSWAQDIPVDEELPYDIYSFHYPDVMKGPKTLAGYQSAVFNSVSQIVKRVPQPVMPSIADEFAHTPIGNSAVKDPNIRNFWGESIKLFWDYMYNTDGSLGGHQFGVFTALGTGVNSPEEWLLRKAYSPVSIDEESLTLSGKNLTFKVQNRFSHTNLNEIKLEWRIGDRSESVMCPSLVPAQHGEITLSLPDASSGDEIEMAFIREDGFQVDEYQFTIDPKPYKIPEFSNEAPNIADNDNSVIISGGNFELTINKQSGQIESGIFDDNLIITGGPEFNISGTKETLPEWHCNAVNASVEEGLAVVKLTGSLGESDAEFTLHIDNEGMIATEYLISGFRYEPQPKTDVPWNRSYYGGYSEVGVKYELTGDIDRLSWDRKALWTVYPENHIGAPKGTAYKIIPEDPNDWGTFSADRGTYMSRRPGELAFTNNFRGMKEYIRTATAYLADDECGIQVFSPMTDAVRMDQSPDDDSKIEMIINNQWNYPELGLGNYMKRPIYLFENK
ncbi:MAG TPA: glycoside hydrolase family 2 TIM barrel-domain containing protein, partial [Draconibacterium sp.]|nr:glycoside hydrolase family 2 TIM barrel-domain containing protein [Draconibacterium sp.]